MNDRLERAAEELKIGGNADLGIGLALLDIAHSLREILISQREIANESKRGAW